MQPQQQTVVAQPTIVQPTYISQPYLEASVVNSYRHRQSTVIGILLIILGALSIVFNLVDLIVGNNWRRWNPHYNTYYTSYHYDSVGYYQRESLSWMSNGDTGHGLWCGVVVSIQFNSEIKDYFLKNTSSDCSLYISD